MIGPDAGQAWLSVSIFIIVVAIVLMLSLPVTSAGFVVSTISLIFGLLLLAGLVIMIRHSQK